MRVRDLELQTEGIVRVMHPGSGMGVQFTNHAEEDSRRVENFIQTLVSSEGAVPAVEVKPDSIDNSPEALSTQQTSGKDGDLLLALFNDGSQFSAEDFHAELRKQRGASQEVTV
jgi:hypothetical protein